jgi:hypothetical protein
MVKNKPLAIEWIHFSFLSPGMKAAYADILEARYSLN